MLNKAALISAATTIVILAIALRIPQARPIILGS